MLRGRKGQAYNIGVEKPEISMRELAGQVVKIANDLFNYKGKVLYQQTADKDYLADNPNRRCPNIDKSRNELEYNPSIALEEGLKRSLIWYYDNRYGEEA
jgi:dTDP-glucose 4,6-dehydratase/UDP-glucuronate decarboxylase